MTSPRGRWPAALRPVLLFSSIATALVVWVTWYGGGTPSDGRALYMANYEHPEFRYLWSPAFAQITAPLREFPFNVYIGLIRAAELACLVLLAPYGAWLAFWLPPVASEVNAANLNIVLIACVVVGFRWPAAWALPLLTKPSMGVGLLWFAVRGEWRRLAIAVGATGGIAAASFFADPYAWVTWVTMLTTFSDTPGWPFPIPVWPRLPVAVALVVWGARTNRPWTVALAAIIAMPRLYFMTPAMLIGLLPLLRGGSVASSTLARRASPDAVNVR